MDFEATSTKHRGEFGSRDWTLCIGAGVSQGLVPTWSELCRIATNESFDSNLGVKEFEKLTADLGWSLDSWIQACANQFRRTGRTLNEFHDLLAEALYGQLRQSARSYGIEKHLLIALKNPRHVQKKETIKLAEFFEECYGNTSLLALARVLIRCTKASKLPRAIVTFNADTLLHTVIELLQRRDKYLGDDPQFDPRYHFTTVLRGLHRLPWNNTPIFHIHGAIKPDTPVYVTKGYDSRDKLIFLEEDFLRVATNSSSWPETTFVFHSQVSRLVFVGMSMSDSNVRRWLSSSRAVMADDMRMVAGIENFVPPHVWVTRKPSDVVRAQVQSAGVSHLGVRCAWLRGWAELGDGLENLLAL